MNIITTCATCQPDEDDRGILIMSDYPCWYALAEAEALKIILLAALGANPRSVAVKVAIALDPSAHATITCLASESRVDSLVEIVAVTFDIPRLLRRANGFEQEPRCGADLDPVRTPLTRAECLSVVLARLILSKAGSQERLRELTMKIGVRVEKAREEAQRKGQSATVEIWISPAEQIYIVAQHILEQCGKCPETRPNEDREPLE